MWLGLAGACLHCFYLGWNLCCLGYGFNQRWLKNRVPEFSVCIRIPDSRLQKFLDSFVNRNTELAQSANSEARIPHHVSHSPGMLI